MLPGDGEMFQRYIACGGAPKDGLLSNALQAQLNATYCLSIFQHLADQWMPSSSIAASLT
jgi:hypothetical protein